MAKRKKAANGHVSPPSDGLPPDEVFHRHLNKIRPAVAKLNKSYDQSRRLRTALTELYQAAEKDGCNRKGFVAAIAVITKGGAADEIAVELRTTGRILRLAEHALVIDHGLFPDLPLAPKPKSPYQMGAGVGRSAGSLDENPFKPGSDNFIEWRDGYDAGQRVNFESLRKTSEARGTADATT
jgi:hypothetical protein